MESPLESRRDMQGATPGWGMPTNTEVSVRQIITSGLGEAHSLCGTV